MRKRDRRKSPYLIMIWTDRIRNFIKLALVVKSSRALECPKKAAGGWLWQASMYGAGGIPSKYRDRCDTESVRWRQNERSSSDWRQNDGSDVSGDSFLYLYFSSIYWRIEILVAWLAVSRDAVIFDVWEP